MSSMSEDGKFAQSINGKMRGVARVDTAFEASSPGSFESSVSRLSRK